MHKFPRALPEGRAPADALLMVEAECEHMTDACRRLDAQVRREGQGGKKVEG
jgi:hypothetical protein